MIQQKFIDTQGLLYEYGVFPEFYIPGGSKQGLPLATAGRYGEPGFKALLGGTPTGGPGYADIVGLVTPTSGDIYEIKNRKEVLWGIAELAWYIQVNNANPDQPMLYPGRLYTWSPDEELIGTNPYYPDQEIVANMDVSQAPGVILYRGRDKSQQQPVPQPRFVWEWDWEKRKVEKRELVPVYYYTACPSPEIADVAKKAAGDTVKIAGITAIVWSTIKLAEGFVGFLLGGPPGALAAMGLLP
jgi:hypothetical protein